MLSVSVTVCLLSSFHSQYIHIFPHYHQPDNRLRLRLYSKRARYQTYGARCRISVPVHIAVNRALRLPLDVQARGTCSPNIVIDTTLLPYLLCSCLDSKGHQYGTSHHHEAVAKIVSKDLITVYAPQCATTSFPAATMHSNLVSQALLITQPCSTRKLATAMVL